ncbi:MAG: hydroxymethylbilane synthase [Balneolaceae bacterium]
MEAPLRIGTRGSRLALWQAERVAEELAKSGQSSEIVVIRSEGDMDRTTPLSEMGGKGVFTKALDEAMLRGEIDLAVHSCKDLPVHNPLPLRIAAILEREDPRDALVAPGGAGFLKPRKQKVTVATGSNRRRSQWLHRYPEHQISGLRGNVETRLVKIDEMGWDGAIFAAAGLKRLGLENRITEYLDWMVPAPAQGAVAVVVQEEREALGEFVSGINHSESSLCTGLERELLGRMEAGCSAPVGAYARVQGQEVVLHAVALTLDGSLQYDLEQSAPVESASGLGIRVADELLTQGAGRVIDELRKP